MRTIKQKLERFYDFNIIEDVRLREQHANNVSVIYEAIKFEQMIKICGYRSNHSNTKTDRIVEPFLLMNNNNEVRCYELASEQCKTFKLSRMESVELIDLRWSYADRHKQMFTDVFMFSSEQPQTVELSMGRLSSTILVEEFPDAEQYLSQTDDSHWHLAMPVCSFLGIGRFVKGLKDDIEVIAPDSFREYIDNATAR